MFVEVDSHFRAWEMSSDSARRHLELIAMTMAFVSEVLSSEVSGNRNCLLFGR